jgi:hypothetical protein
VGSFDGRVLASQDSARASSGGYQNNVGMFGYPLKVAIRVYGRWKPVIDAGATITSAILYLTASAANTSVFYSNVYLISQSSYNCGAFSSTPWAWTNYATPVRFPLVGNLPDWVLDTEYASPDISALVQQWVNSVADPTTAYIGLMVHEGDASGDKREPYLYADSSTKCLRLVVNWTTAGGAAVQVKRRLLLGVGLQVDVWNLNKHKLKFPRLTPKTF